MNQSFDSRSLILSLRVLTQEDCVPVVVCGMCIQLGGTQKAGPRGCRLDSLHFDTAGGMCVENAVKQCLPHALV